LEIYKGSRYNEKLVFDIKLYQKPQNKYLYLPPNSFHPKSVFKAFISAEIDRYRLCCNNDSDFDEIKKQFHSRLIARGYKEDYLKSIFDVPRDRKLILGKIDQRILDPTKKKSKNLEVPILFKTKYTPQAILMQLAKCLELNEAAQLERGAINFFNFRNPIRCFSNSSSIGSYFSKNRKNLHGLSADNVQEIGSMDQDIQN
jgi:hypothetical protein